MRSSGENGVSLVIVISGATASGKSTFASLLSEALFEDRPALLGQDQYFQELGEEDRATEITSNHPRAVLWDQLVEHLKVLKSGGAVMLPVTGARSFSWKIPRVKVGPSDVVIVEGHLLFNEPRIHDLADLTVFLDANVHERVVRRLLRDTRGESKTLDQATDWYRRDVLPNVSTYSESLREMADVIVPFDRENRKAVDVVADWVRDQLTSDP